MSLPPGRFNEPGTFPTGAVPLRPRRQHGPAPAGPAPAVPPARPRLEMRTASRAAHARRLLRWEQSSAAPGTFTDHRHGAFGLAQATVSPVPSIGRGDHDAGAGNGFPLGPRGDVIRLAVADLPGAERPTRPSGKRSLGPNLSWYNVGTGGGRNWPPPSARWPPWPSARATHARPAPLAAVAA
jgi:hypothetical protein